MAFHKDATSDLAAGELKFFVGDRWVTATTVSLLWRAKQTPQQFARKKMLILNLIQIDNFEFNPSLIQIINFN